PKTGAGMINAIDLRVGDPHKALTLHNLFKRTAWPGQERTSCAEPFGELRITTHSGWVETFAIICAKNAVDCLAKAGRLFEKRIESRGEVAGRGVDDSQYFGGRGLLLQCFARLGH